MPRDLKQLRSFLGLLSYYRMFHHNMSKGIRLITVLFMNGVKSSFTPTVECIVGDMLAALTAPPVPILPGGGGRLSLFPGVSLPASTVFVATHE